MSEESLQPEQPVSRFEVRQFGDTHGRRITQLCPLDGTPVQYSGQQTRIVRTASGQQHGVPFGFPIQAITIDQAFDAYDTGADAEWPNVLARVKEQVTAARMPKIAIPGGALGSRFRHN